MNSKSYLSAIILTKNEEQNILDCLESVEWVDEILIVDDYSEDRTLEVVKTLPFKDKIKIYQNKLNGNFAGQRNYALSKANTVWAFFVDADERVSKELRKEINSILIEEKNSGKNNGFYIQRKDYMWNKLLKHGESSNVSLLRLGKKESGEWVGSVHEVWRIDRQTGNLNNSLLHYPHPTVNEFLNEINYYSTLRADELYINKIKSSVLSIIAYPSGKFILNYFLKRGFLDGIGGLIFALMMSFHSFLVRSKLWLLWQKKSTSFS